MAKRFTDTGKWKKEFFKALPAKYKLLWFYILDDCDHAGVWEVDMEIASIRIGEKLDQEEAVELMAEQIVIVGRNKWWVRDFINFQYGERFAPKNKMYEPVMAVLRKLQIDQIFLDYQEKGDKSPIYGVKVRVQEKVEEKENIKEPEIILEDGNLEPVYNDLTRDTLLMTFRETDVDDQWEKFKAKVRGSPQKYQNHDVEGLRLAFHYHLQKAPKKQANGKVFNKNDRTEFNQNELAIINQHTRSPEG